MINSKKGEIGTIILLLLLIGAIYVVNHPPQENTVIIQNGICEPANLDTKSTKITFINKDDTDYIIKIGDEVKNISKNSKIVFQFPKGIHYYSCEAHPSVEGKIGIS